MISGLPWASTRLAWLSSSPMEILNIRFDQQLWWRGGEGDGGTHLVRAGSEMCLATTSTTAVWTESSLKSSP